MPSFSEVDRELSALQIREERALVSFDITQFTIGHLCQEFSADQIVIPEYQRDFVWDTEKRCRLIESALLGLPIPFLFAADQAGFLEIVDGSQRLRTFRSFLDGELVLKNLEILDRSNGMRFGDLDGTEQRRFRNRTIRMVVLSDSADLSTRFEVFSRINSGSLKLEPPEFRKGAFPSDYYAMVQEFKDDEVFREVCPMSDRKVARGELEELALRFLVYSQRYQDFRHDVERFLNRFVAEHDACDPAKIEADRQSLRDVTAYVSRHFDSGFGKPGVRQTPRVRFEAISVGVWLALQDDLDPQSMPNLEWLESEEFRRLTTSSASNSGPKLKARVEYVRDQLLERD